MKKKFDYFRVIMSVSDYPRKKFPKFTPFNTTFHGFHDVGVYVEFFGFYFEVGVRLKLSDKE